MEQFLDMFGGVSVTIAQLAGLGVIIFSAYGAGKKAKEYFSEKKKTIIEKARAEHDKDEEWQKIASQVAQYPEWHDQSIQIRDGLAKSINGLDAKIDQISSSLAKMRREAEESRATTCRYRILRFDDEVRHRNKHTKEHFDQILEDIKAYEDYCEGHPHYENSKAKMAIKNIKRVYDKCNEKGLFYYAVSDVADGQETALIVPNEEIHRDGN